MDANEIQPPVEGASVESTFWERRSPDAGAPIDYTSREWAATIKLMIGIAREMPPALLASFLHQAEQVAIERIGEAERVSKGPTPVTWHTRDDQDRPVPASTLAWQSGFVPTESKLDG